jgi:hypothetical protein
MKHPLEVTAALALCEYHWHAHVHIDKDTLRSEFELLYDTDEFDAGVAYAIQQGWLRPSHVSNRLTLTFAGAHAVLAASLEQV